MAVFVDREGKNKLGEAARQGSPIPLGARVIPSQARPLNGLEVGQGTLEVLRLVLSELRREGDFDSLSKDLSHKLTLYPNFNKPHLTFPAVAWGARGVEYEDRAILPTIKIRVRFDNRTEVEVQVGSSLNLDTIRNQVEVQVGPEPVPDTLRGKLGISSKVEVELPDGKRTMIEVGEGVKVPRTNLEGDLKPNLKPEESLKPAESIKLSPPKLLDKDLLAGEVGFEEDLKPENLAPEKSRGARKPSYTLKRSKDKMED